MEDTGRRYLHDTVDTTMTSSTSTLISIPLCDLSGVYIKRTTNVCEFSRPLGFQKQSFDHGRDVFYRLCKDDHRRYLM